MLVLGRKPGESVIINDNIIVTVIQDNAGKLRLQFEAPKEIEIVRGEIYKPKNLND